MAALTGQPTDRTPWSPNLAYWWEAQPQEKTACGQLAYLEQISADPLLRGTRKPWTEECKGVSFRHGENGNWHYGYWDTPVGTLRFGSMYSPSANTWFLAEHPVKTVEDLKTVQWIYERLVITPDATADREHREVGQRGLYVPLIGTEMKTCFQSLLEKWVGLENLVEFLDEAPEVVEECLQTMRYASNKTIPCCTASEAEAFIFWEDTSTTTTSPAWFQRYIAPEITHWADELHKAGKLLMHHACGSLKALLPMMAQTGIDVIESISPPPTGNLDIGDALLQLPESIALIGGIEPVFFQDCTREQLEQRVEYLLKTTRGRRYVLANSDSCPPAVEEWKLQLVSELVKK